MEVELYPHYKYIIKHTYILGLNLRVRGLHRLILASQVLLKDYIDNNI